MKRVLAEHVPNQSSSSTKQIPCKFFLTNDNYGGGFCKFGSGCRFSHNQHFFCGGGGGGRGKDKDEDGSVGVDAKVARYSIINTISNHYTNSGYVESLSSATAVPMRRHFKNPTVLRSSDYSSLILLPIAKYRQKLLDSVKLYATTIVIGETGSGKSTQLPQYLADTFIDGCILCTQPRRVAAITIAKRVSEERGVALGREVGYSVRFDDKSSSLTRIKYVTDGVLLRELMANKDLKGYSVVVLDEAHERSVQTDILIGLLRQLQSRRADLKVVVMSATLQAEVFLDYFSNPNLVTIPGRQFPVSVYYTKVAEPDYTDAAMLTCMQIHEGPMDMNSGRSSGDGHNISGGGGRGGAGELSNFNGVLVFLPGQEDIENLTVLLEDNLPTVSKSRTLCSDLSEVSRSAKNIGDFNTNIKFLSSTYHKVGGQGSKKVNVGDMGYDFEVFPLYASLSADEQIKAFLPAKPGVRKFVLATNIAETSVTISGIKYVVDTGKVKSRFINVTTGMEMLKVTPISKAQANQRTGRAGRECPGYCYRLFPESAFEELDIESSPEIQRINISQIILQLKELNVDDVTKFPFISPPPTISFHNSFDILIRLNALDKNQRLSTLGRKMASLPLEPMFAHLLLKSVEFQCVSEVLTSVAVLSTENMFVCPNKESEKELAARQHSLFRISGGDMFILNNIFNAWVKSNLDPHWASRNYISYRALMQAHNIRSQLKELLHKMNINCDSSCNGNKESFVRCLANGLPLNIAMLATSVDTAIGNRMRGDSKDNNVIFNIGAHSLSSSSYYQTLRGGQLVNIHPSSSLFGLKEKPKYIVFAELIETSKLYMRNCTEIDEKYLNK